MKHALILLLLLSGNALAEDNPFYPPLKRIAPVALPDGLPNPAIGLPGAPSSVILPIIDPVAQRKKNDLVGARMVAIIDKEEVWYKPDQGIYVRYPVDLTSVGVLEAPKPEDDIQQIKQAIAPEPIKSKTIKGAKAKSW